MTWLDCPADVPGQARARQSRIRIEALPAQRGTDEVARAQRRDRREKNRMPRFGTGNRVNLDDRRS